VSPTPPPEELLHRQVHPNFVLAGRVSSQAFIPTPKDEGKLSVDLGSLTTPQAALARYRGEGRASAGVWSITVGECSSLGLPTVPDPITGEHPNPAHAYVDFQGLSKADTRAKGQLLARAAHARGMQHTTSE
jgi:hypothetical protein